MQIKDNNHTHQFEAQMILSACCCVQVVYPEDRWRLPSAEEMETVPSQQRECLARDQVFWPPTRYRDNEN